MSIEDHLRTRVGTASEIRNLLQPVESIGACDYHPRSDTIVLALDDIPIRSVPKDFLAMFMGGYRELQHEGGHHSLSWFTRLGTCLRDLASVTTGLAAVILERMVREHGRVWIPFADYGSRGDTISKLIESAARLRQLEQDLATNWRVTHEVFALDFAASTTSIVEAGTYWILGCDSRTAARLYGASERTHCSEDSARALARIAEERGIDTRQLSYKDLLSTLADACARDSPAFADIVRRILGGPYPFDVRSASVQALRAMTEEYARSDECYRRAAAVVSEQGEGMESAMAMVLACRLLSNYYAPRLTAASVLDGTASRVTTGPDTVLQALGGKAGETVIRCAELLAEDPLAGLWHLREIQRQMDSVPFDQVLSTPEDEILGTEAWFADLIGRLPLTARERKRLQRLAWTFGRLEPLDFLKGGGLGKVRESHTMRLLPWPLRALLSRGLGTPGSMFATLVPREVRPLLWELGVHDVASADRVLRVYGAALATPVGMELHEGVAPSVGLLWGTTEVNVLLRSSCASDQTQLAGLRTVWAGVTEAALDGAPTGPTVCLHSSIFRNGTGNGLSPGVSLSCPTRRLVPAGALVVCCRDGEAIIDRGHATPTSVPLHYIESVGVPRERRGRKRNTWRPSQPLVPKDSPAWLRVVAMCSWLLARFGSAMVLGVLLFPVSMYSGARRTVENAHSRWTNRGVRRYLSRVLVLAAETRSDDCGTR